MFTLIGSSLNSFETFFLLTFAVSIAAGLLGALAGLGGGVMVVPLLTIGFGLDIRYAIGASIVSVIATSNGAGAALMRDGLTNLRIATLLQVATTIGAIAGALIAPHVAVKVLFLLFGGLLMITAIATIGKIRAAEEPVVESDALAIRLQLPGVLPGPNGAVRPYGVRNVPLGIGLMSVAGVVSGLLGIGSGALKVAAMDNAMGLPIKVSSATSNYMIGVTAAASAGVYFWRGDVLPFVAAPVALGVLIGSIAGGRLLVRWRSTHIRMIFTALLVLVAIEMILRGVGIA